MKNVFEAEGDLREVDPLAALVSCWRERSSGSLRFARGPSECGFDLADGDVVAIVSSDPRFDTAAILVRAGKLAADAVERLSGEGADAALLALQSGLLTRREWKWGEKIRAIEVFSDLLSWNDGRYRFDASAAPAAGELRLPVPRLLLELFLRSRDRNLVEHQLGPPDQALVRGERFDEEFPTFGLTADAESVVRLIDGRSTAAQIAEKAPADEFAVRKLLAALVTLGLVHPVPSAATRAPERPRVPEPPPAPPEPAWPEEAEQAEKAEEAEEPSFEPHALETPIPEIVAEPFEASLPEIPEPVPEAPSVELPGVEPSPLDDLSPSSPDPRWTPRHEEGVRPEMALFDAPGGDLPIEPSPEPADEPAPPRGGGFLTWALGVLVLAVLGVVVWRLRERTPAPSAAPPRATAAAAVTFPPPATAAAGAPARATAAPPAPTTAPVIATAVPGAAPRPTAASARPAAAALAPASASALPPSTKGSEPDSREAWNRRAERDRRRLESDRRARYATKTATVTVASGAAIRRSRRRAAPRPAFRRTS